MICIKFSQKNFFKTKNLGFPKPFSDFQLWTSTTWPQWCRTTRKLCHRKDDRAMRPIYDCLLCLFTESD